MPAPSLPLGSSNAQLAEKRLRLGISLSPQSTNWDALRRAAGRIDRLGYEYLWTWDHLLAPLGASDQPIFESGTVLAALSQVTTAVKLGALVAANTFRHPALLAKMVITLDHVSGGRAILGLGAGWLAEEHQSNGIDFGTGPGDRIARMGEAARAIRGLMSTETIDLEGDYYRFEGARHLPGPFAGPIRLLIGGSGERKTLPIVARYADVWNAKGSPDVLAAKDRVLVDFCRDIGRDPDTIERSVNCRMLIRDRANDALRVWQSTLGANRASPASEPDPWLGTPAQVAAILRTYLAAGFTTVNVSMPSPFDDETIERLIGEVAPMALSNS